MIVDKTKIRQSFAAASGTYDAAAELQRIVGKILIATIDTTTLAGTIVDLGCGTGFLSIELLTLASSDPEAIIALDIALPMLQATRSKLAGQHNINYVCADAEHLPFAEKSIDHLFSNLALQWCSQLNDALADMKRILKPDGRLVFSTFGPQTLQELKAAWASVDHYKHVNDFYNEQQLKSLLQQAGFKQIRIESTVYTPLYDSVLTLMHELKHLGARTVSSGRSQQLTGKAHMQHMFSAYERYRQDNRLPATFEVILVSASS